MFGSALAGFAAAQAARADEENRRTKFYTLEVFQLKQGSQAGRMHDWFGNFLLPRLAKIHPGPTIALDAVIAPHTPQIALIVGYSSLNEITDVLAKMNEPEALSAWDKIERGAEPPFETQSVSILQAAPYSPELRIDKDAKRRYFELRTYHSPTGSQLRALHNRFSSAETKIFHRSGISPLFYTSTMVGAQMPNLVYLIPFDSLAAREKAWNAFGADPEWVKTREESVQKFGQITDVIDVCIYRATAYSPIQ
jgi:hypothetical protein